MQKLLSCGCAQSSPCQWLKNVARLLSWPGYGFNISVLTGRNFDFREVLEPTNLIANPHYGPWSKTSKFLYIGPSAVIRLRLLPGIVTNTSQHPSQYLQFADWHRYLRPLELRRARTPLGLTDAKSFDKLILILFLFKFFV